MVFQNEGQGSYGVKLAGGLDVNAGSEGMDDSLLALMLMGLASAFMFWFDTDNIVVW